MNSKRPTLTDLFKERGAAIAAYAGAECTLAQARARLSAAERAVNAALDEIVWEDGELVATPAPIGEPGEAP